MRIAFCAQHPYWGGFSNGGGTRTIMRSAMVLKELGHKVSLVGPSDKFTWFPHPKVRKDVPRKLDIAIACSISDILPMISKAHHAKVQAYWMRGLEFWQKDRYEIMATLETFKKRGGKIICNASHLVDWCSERNIGADLCYAGIDFDQWHMLERAYSPLTVGCLYSKQHKTKGWAAYCELLNRLPDTMYGRSFGTRRPKDAPKNNRHISNPSHAVIRSLYNEVDVWFAPTTLEGFHNPPVEAALCGCAILCSDAPHNGMSDYANEDTAMIYHTIDEAAEYCRNPKYETIPAMQALLHQKIGSRQHNMARLVELLK